MSVQHPTPSKVNHRLEIARDIPIPVNSKKMRIIRYKNILAQEGKEEDIKSIEELLKQLEEQGNEKEQESFEEGESKIIHHDQACNESQKSLYFENNATSKRDEMKIEASLEFENLSASHDNEVTEHSKISWTEGKLPNNWRRLNSRSFTLTRSFEEKDKCKENIKDDSRRSLPTKFRQLKLNHADFIRNVLRTELNKAKAISKNSASNENDVNLESEKLIKSNNFDVPKSKNLIESNLFKGEHRGLTVNRKNELEDDIDVITVRLQRSFGSPLDEKIERNCICNRTACKTRCTSCGGVMNGRVLRFCKDHPKVSFPEDNYYCGQCLADISMLRDVTDE